jgi:hypothetical protein
VEKISRTGHDLAASVIAASDPMSQHWQHNKSTSKVGAARLGLHFIPPNANAGTHTRADRHTHINTHLDGLIQLLLCGDSGHGHDGPQTTLSTQHNVGVQTVTLTKTGVMHMGVFVRAHVRGWEPCACACFRNSQSGW